MRILIVEDDKTSGEFILRVLERYAECDIAISGIEAVDAFLLAHDEGMPYDLICLDLMLPLFDGEDVLAAIRKIENEKGIRPDRRVKVIITSALKDKELTAKLTQSGFDQYFLKPLNAEEIIKYIKSI